MQPDTIKYTTILPLKYIDDLKEMAERQQIPSVNHGIRTAIGRYLDEEHKRAYAAAMRAASQDPDFVRRTMETQEAFSAVDADMEGGGEW